MEDAVVNGDFDDFIHLDIDQQDEFDYELECINIEDLAISIAIKEDTWIV